MKDTDLLGTTDFIMTRAQAKKYMYYQEIFLPVLTVTKAYNAKIDITERDKGKVFVVNCSANCRRKLKHIFGEGSVEKKEPKVTQLIGFS